RKAGELYEALHGHGEKEGSSALLHLMHNTHEGLNSLAAQESNLHGMGATLTLVWLSPGHLHFAHLADSRLYLHREEKTAQLTTDHTRAWGQWNRGEINEFAYRTHPRRSALYDALGGGHPNIRPQIESHPLQDDDRLLLCTDGIIDGLWERGLATELAGHGEPADLAPRILTRARENSRDDDASLIVVRIAQL
ncbi:MAG: protein phosphatase 2C domain-containing protein, partial [Verrucomicrobiota bacterium]|nr:protein phosphatase 2C domain-containing protein [Verrucomicrobiota bacterium]